jgi:deoxycytidylate deaminase
VLATLVCGAETFYATNYCLNPQKVCPRADLASGVGYEMCRDICKQVGHAEINVLAMAKEKAKGSTMSLKGHTYVCDSCMAALKKAGVKGVFLLDKQVPVKIGKPQ